MARYTGPRLRVLRALGTNLPGLSAKTIDKRPNPPGQHGAKRRKASSNYGKRLKEKQKLRAHYGVSERQLRTVATAAARARGNAAAALVELLERRLDNVVFRAGLARTIPAARQLVTHGHVSVNGRRHTYPSARLERGDVIGVLGPRGQAAVTSQQALGRVLEPPTWLDVNSDGHTATMTSLPGPDAVPFPIELPLIVEFYS